MVQRDQIIRYLEEVFGRDHLALSMSIDDYPNGVQFQGSDNVEVVTLGVSCNEQFLHEAVKRKSTFSIFHHGFDVRTWKSRIPKYSQKRLKLIIENNMTIAGYHYALDTHKTIGNNAVILRLLGARLKDTLFDSWGFVGSYDVPVRISELRNKCVKLFNHEVLSFETGKEEVTTIGVVSGGAKPYAEHIAEMEAKGVQVFITGESSESAPHRMMESGISYFVCGHYATEVFGVKELGTCIEKKFGNLITVEYIDIPNVL